MCVINGVGHGNPFEGLISIPINVKFHVVLSIIFALNLTFVFSGRPYI